MFTENFYEGIEIGLMQKVAFPGSGLITAPIKAIGKGLGFVMKGFKNKGLAKLDKKIGLQGAAQNIAMSTPFAALGAHQYASRAGKSATKSYNPTRSSLMSPVSQKSPMGNIF